MIRYIYIYDYKCKCLQIPELMLMLWDTSCHWDKKNPFRDDFWCFRHQTF